MALCFYGCSKKSRDGFSISFNSPTVALVAVLICIISFAKGGKFSYESMKGFFSDLPVDLQNDSNQ